MLKVAAGECGLGWMTSAPYLCARKVHSLYVSFVCHWRTTTSDDSVCYTFNTNLLEWGMMLLSQGKRAALLRRSVLRRARSTATPTGLLLQGWLQWYSIELRLLGWNLLHTGGVDAGIGLRHSEHVLRIIIIIFIILICITASVLLLCSIKHQSICIPLPNSALSNLTVLTTTVTEICALLGYYAAFSSSSVPTFRGNLSVPSSRVKKSKKTSGTSWPLMSVRCVTSQKRADLTYIAAEARIHAKYRDWQQRLCKAN